MTIFHRPEAYEALEEILAEGLTRYACRIPAYHLMPNHWHFVLQPMEDGVSRFDRSLNGSGDPFYVCNPHQKHTQRKA